MAVGAAASYCLLVSSCCCLTAWNVLTATRLLHDDVTCGSFESASPFGRRAADSWRRLVSPAAAESASAQEVSSGDKFGPRSFGSHKESYSEKSMAHLGSSWFEMSSPNSTIVTRWSADERLKSFAVGSVARGQLGLRVAESGYYFAYSQVGFVLAQRDRASHGAHIVHEIIRIRNATGRAEVVLRAKKSRCWDANPLCSLQTSYMGAVVHLDKDDELTVAVDDVNFIWQSHRRTTVGLRLIE